MAIALLLTFAALWAALALHRSWSDETDAGRNTLVFEGRNRAYGAYSLRMGYGHRLAVACVAAIAVPVLLFALLKGIAVHQPVQAILGPPLIAVDVDLEPPSATADAMPVKPPDLPRPSGPKPTAASGLVEATEATETSPVDLLDTLPGTSAGDVGSGSGPGTGPAFGAGEGDHSTGTGTAWADDRTWEHFELQELPQFPGGEEAMHRWIKRNLELPAGLDENGLVLVQFVVAADGAVEQVAALKGGQRGVGGAVERSLRLMPRWKPGKMNGHEVRCRLVLPINYRVR